jgi:hypothetical protein
LLAALACDLLTLPPDEAGASAPIVAIDSASEVGTTTAKASGDVAPGGMETTYRFEYISDEEFDDNEGDGLSGFAGATQTGFGFLPAAAGQTEASATLGGLASGVRYHLRLVAENDDGTTAATAPEFVTIGGAPDPEVPIPCFGDSCQVLPPEPIDPALGTLVPGLGNPKVHYFKYGRHRPKKNRRHAKKPAKKKSANQKNGSPKGSRK